METCDGSCAQPDLALGALRPGPAVRHRLDDGWVARLLDAVDELPPLVVHCPTRRIVDGQHRLAVARRRGDALVSVVWHHGMTDDLYAEAVRRNAGHGLALTLPERRGAAAVLLRADPQRSDRGPGENFCCQGAGAPAERGWSVSGTCYCASPSGSAVDDGGSGTVSARVTTVST